MVSQPHDRLTAAHRREGLHLHQPGQTELMVMPRCWSKGLAASFWVAAFSMALVKQSVQHQLQQHHSMAPRKTTFTAGMLLTPALLPGGILWSPVLGTARPGQQVEHQVGHTGWHHLVAHAPV